MYGSDYHHHSEYAQEGHHHWDYAPERHEHALWEVSGAASTDHDHDLSEVWAAIATIEAMLGELRAALNHQET